MTWVQTYQLSESEKPLNEESPEGWIRVKLPEVSAINMGQSPPGTSYNDHGKGLPFFQGKADFGERYPKVRMWCTEPKKIANPGDVLLSIRAPVGPTNVADRKCTIGRGLAALTPLGGIPTELVLFAMRLLERVLSLSGTGSTFTAINKKDIHNIEISLPPLAEQKRMVAKVEQLLARVNAARDRLAKVPQILKRFRQSVLSSATSGKLTGDWRDVPGINRTFDRVKLKDVVNSIQIGPFGSLLHKSDYVEDAVPVINPTNIKNGKIQPSPHVTITNTKKSELARYVLQEDDVVIGRRGEMGRCAVVRKNQAGWLCGTGSLFVRPGSKMVSDFVQMLISSPPAISYLEGASVGSTMTNLNQKIFFNMEIEAPGVEEQHEIVRRVQALFKLADKIQARHEKAKSHVDKLTQTILAKAFRGELVPTEAELAPREGRFYEPASVLLDKIEAQRKDVKPQRKRGRSRQRRNK